MTGELKNPWPDEDADETWQTAAPPVPRGGDAFASLHNAERAFVSALAGAVLEDPGE